MPRGNPPKPIALRQREEGSHHGRSVVSHRPIGPRIELSDDLLDVELTPPANLGPAGLQVWRESVQSLADCGALSVGDLPSARMMAEAFDEYARANEIIEREGMFAYTAAGVPKVHPAVHVAASASSRFLRFAVELGATPAARTRIGLEQIRGVSLSQELDSKLGWNPRRVD